MKNNEFGKNLKRLRTFEGISQKKLGEDLQVVNQTVSSWETGAREPDLDMLVKIAVYFGVDVDYLLDADYKRR